MKTINIELKRVQNVFTSLDQEAIKKAHRNRIFGDDREWWILGKFKNILQTESIPFPDRASKLPQNDSDFKLDNGVIVQITETVPNNLDSSDAWSKFSTLLNNKFSHFFGKRSWLIIYFDILYSSISEYGYWHNYILKESLKLDFSNCPYEKIFVINASGEAAVSIFPYSFVIKPEWINGKTIIDKCLYQYNSYYKILDTMVCL